LRILFDKNVPVGVRAFLQTHEVRTTVEIGWPDQLENGELLKKAEESGFDVMVTSEHPVSAESHRSQARAGRAGLKHLADRAHPCQVDISYCRCSRRGELRIHRNATAAKGNAGETLRASASRDSLSRVAERSTKGGEVAPVPSRSR
jgi:hypothetical protein